MHMDTILIAVTAISLAIASVLGVLLQRAVREERRRSEARVNLLMDLTAPEPVPTARAPRFSDVGLPPAAVPPADAGTLFQPHDAETAWPRRLVAAGALATALGIVVLGWHSFGRISARPAEAATHVRAPLELLSLSYRQQDGAFVITGLVQNPHGAATLANVQATAMVFGADGTLLSTGRAPLDFTALPPGAESPFVIHVTTTGAAKYRVAFRDAQGEALAHVDRRNPDAIARKDTP